MTERFQPTKLIDTTDWKQKYIDLKKKYYNLKKKYNNSFFWRDQFEIRNKYVMSLIDELENMLDELRDDIIGRKN